MARIRILNNSAGKKGKAPMCIIGLSHPIIKPSHSNQSKYIKLTAIKSLTKFLNIFETSLKESSNLNEPTK